MRLAIVKRNTALGAGLVLAGALGSSVGSIGGIGADHLGADITDVSSCDSDGIDVAWQPVFDDASAQYVTDFTLSDIAAECLGSPYEFSIFALGRPAERVSGSFDQLEYFTQYDRPSDGQAVVRASYRSLLPAEAVEGIAIVVHG